MTDLKRCPFCGSIDLDAEGGELCIQVDCWKCGAMGPAADLPKGSKREELVAEAARLWNSAPR